VANSSNTISNAVNAPRLAPAAQAQSGAQPRAVDRRDASGGNPGGGKGRVERVAPGSNQSSASPSVSQRGTSLNIVV